MTPKANKTALTNLDDSGAGQSDARTGGGIHAGTMHPAHGTPRPSSSPLAASPSRTARFLAELAADAMDFMLGRPSALANCIAPGTPKRFRVPARQPGES